MKKKMKNSVTCVGKNNALLEVFKTKLEICLNLLCGQKENTKIAYFHRIHPAHPKNVPKTLSSQYQTQTVNKLI